MTIDQDDTIDVEAADVVGFGHATELSEFRSGWHAHGKHQLLYAVAGTLHLHTRSAQALLPPGRAAWIAAGAEHDVAVRRHASLRTVYLHKSIESIPPKRCQIFAVQPVAREMILYAMRWPIDREPDPTADLFFRTLAGLCVEWVETPEHYALPRAESEELQRAIEWTLEHLDEATLPSAAKRAFVSARTLTRRFKKETGTTWRRFLHAARLIQAMEWLVDRTEWSVIKVAQAVGFDSPSAFSHAFAEYVGQTPSEYRNEATP